MGAATGAAVAGSRGDALSAAIGAVLGAIAVAAAEALTERERSPGAPKPEWHRIAMVTLFAGAVGGLVDLATAPFPLRSSPSHSGC
jgi:uncharacterized protein involved in response to NO